MCAVTKASSVVQRKCYTHVPSASLRLSSVSRRPKLQPLSFRWRHTSFRFLNFPLCKEGARGPKFVHVSLLQLAQFFCSNRNAKCSLLFRSACNFSQSNCYRVTRRCKLLKLSQTTKWLSAGSYKVFLESTSMHDKFYSELYVALWWLNFLKNWISAVKLSQGLITRPAKSCLQKSKIPTFRRRV